jgi:hypothetical protein
MKQIAPTTFLRLRKQSRQKRLPARQPRRWSPTRCGVRSKRPSCARSGQGTPSTSYFYSRGCWLAVESGYARPPLAAATNERRRRATFAQFERRSKQGPFWYPTRRLPCGSAIIRVLQGRRSKQGPQWNPARRLPARPAQQTGTAMEPRAASSCWTLDLGMR